jgi:hypothetical protein
MGNYRIWHFIVGRLDFYMKADQRPFPIDWQPFLANYNDPNILCQTPERNVETLPLLWPKIGFAVALPDPRRDRHSAPVRLARPRRGRPQ